jgi:phosphate transport system ATP-binding protein
VRAERLSKTHISVQRLNAFYDGHHTLKDIPEKQVTVIIGPSGCGKTTLLECLDRQCGSHWKSIVQWD